MTDIDDKVLDAWLDKYPHMMSPSRLQNLEERILSEIQEEESFLFAPLSLGEGVGAMSLVGLVSLVLVFIVAGNTQIQNATDWFSLSMYGGF